MKQILITVANAKKIKSVLDDVQKRTKVRKATVYDVYDFTVKLFDTVKVPKRLLDGVSVLCDTNAQDFPRAYKYTPESTIFKISVKNGKPYLADVSRGTCQRNSFDWCFPSDTRQAIADSLLYNVTHGSLVRSPYFDKDKIREILNKE